MRCLSRSIRWPARQCTVVTGPYRDLEGTWHRRWVESWHAPRPSPEAPAASPFQVSATAADHQGSAAGAARQEAFAPADGRRAFVGSNTSGLLFSCALLELCRRRALVTLGAGVLGWAARPGGGLAGRAILWAVRRTAFAHFCGGETLQECVATAEQLAARGRVRCIVDWSIEEREDASAWDVNAEKKCESLRAAAKALGTNAAFVPVKLTALVSPGLLERVTAAALAGGDEAAMAQLNSGEDAALWNAALVRLRRLCGAARDCGVPLLLDAEQSGRQPAVHFLARVLQREFNVAGAAVVYDTMQMYLQAAPSRLDKALAAAQAGGYTYAVKLVRGAYIEQESPLAVVHATKASTDAAYDAAAARLLSAVANGSQVAVVLATHNRASLEHATAQMESLGLARDHPQVHFAQILGMVDNLTNALGLAGYNATKLVVFGQVREVLPWMLRRVHENRDAFGAQATELPVLRGELQRRFLGALPGR